MRSALLLGVFARAREIKWALLATGRQDEDEDGEYRQGTELENPEHVRKRFPSVQSLNSK